jgi:hypothetical protein
MALSVANVTAWDFTDSTDPRLSKTGQTGEEFVLSGGATVNTTNGIECLTGGDLARLTCTNGSLLTGWTLPYTMFYVVTPDRTASVSGSSARLFSRATTGSANNLIGARGSNLTTGVFNFNVDVAASIQGTLPDLTETLLTVEFRTNGLTIWFGTSTHVNNTAQSYTMPTLNTTDVIDFGSRDGNNPKMMCKGFALIPGTTTSQDRTDLTADWRTALFSTGPSAATLARYRKLCKLTK